MNIITVCGMGMGTSLILKMTIDKVLRKEGIKAQIEHSDLGAAKSMNPDLFAISCDMEGMFKELGKKYVSVTSVFDEEAVRETVLPAIKELLASKE
jgi:PTS system ascorbate-specific IIB component